MFSDGSYTKAATGTGYKKISFNGMTEQFISKIWYHLLINNWVLNVILAGILLFLIIKRGKKNFLTAEMSVVFCGFRTISGNPRQFNYRDESAGVCISAQCK